MRGRHGSCAFGRHLLGLAGTLFLVLGWSGNGYAWSGNLLANPGFEKGNEGWGGYASWGTAEPYPSAQAMTESPHSGSWSLKIGPETGGRAQTHGKPRANTTYRIGAWGMVSVAGEIGWAGVEYWDIYRARFTPAVEFTETSYTYKEIEFTTSATIDEMRVFAWKNDGPGYLYIDDVSFVGPDFTFSPGNTTYYVDSVDGDDGKDGIEPESAWRTLDKVNSVVFAPGDRIMLKAGCVWHGQLDPMGSGDVHDDIILQSIGAGPLPIIDGGGTVTAPLRLFNQEHWTVWGLELTNYGTFPRTRYGAWVIGEDAGSLRDISLSGLEVHDVNGLLDDSHKANGGIIFDIRGLSQETWWDDIFIGGCTVRSVDRSGIWLSSWWWDRNLPDGTPGSWVPSTGVSIMTCTVEDAGGDGIVPTVCDGPIVEYNVAANCNTRSGRYCVGIWPWACGNAVIQYNEAYLTRGTNDGEGFDSDWFSNDTIIQYNYSHDNEGGFCLICANGTYDGFNDGTIVRYNISQNDLARAFHIAGPTANTVVHNNTIYIGEGIDSNPIVHSSWGGYADDTHFYNNIFYNLGSGGYDFGSSTNNYFDSNVFYGNHPAGEPADPNKITSDPRLAAPGSGGTGRDTCDGYKLLPDSPCLDSALAIPDNGGMDYWGNPVPSGNSADRGAHEYRQFPDVLLGHWAFVEIGFCVLAGVVQGYPDGLYDPGGAVTRDQMAVYISRALAGGDDSVPEFTGTPSFPDVAEDSWALDYVEYALGQAVVAGYDDGSYHPEYEVTRDQMAVYVARAMVAPSGEAVLADYVPADPQDFPDVASDFWAYRHVEYCVENGVVQGYEDGYYHPEAVVTRDQMAVYVCRAFDLPA